MKAPDEFPHRGFYHAPPTRPGAEPVAIVYCSLTSRALRGLVIPAVRPAMGLVSPFRS